MKIYKNLSGENKFIVKVIALLAILLVGGSMVSKYFVEDGNFAASQNDMMAVGGGVASYATEEYEMGRTGVAIDMPILPPSYGSVPGTDAESFEVSEYYVSIETRDRQRDCDSLLALKGREDVIFENTSESEYGCNVYFKVKRESVDSVLAYLDELDPRDINESTYTVKREVGEYETRIEILQKKLDSLDEALSNALKSYEEVEAIARRSGDISALAQVTESKVTVIERITSSRLEVVAELDQLSKVKADNLDRMNFVYFSVNIYENDWVKGSDLKDSWIVSIQELVRDFNRFLQDLSIGFMQFIFVVIKYALYASVLFLIGRPLLRKVKVLWHKM